MEKELVCINCPMGCRLTVSVKGSEVTGVEGNACKRGVEYAQQEAVCPMRVLTSVMFARDREKPLSVKTDRPVPKALLFRCVDQIFAARPAPPLHCGDVIIADICGTGANVVATQDME
jgi:CxxC motif-containing protein